MAMPFFCLPGDRLCQSDDNHVSGPGTYERKGYIYASLAGVVKSSENNKLFVVSVDTNKGQHTVPTPGDIVTAQIIMTSQRMIRCNIQCIRDTPLEKSLRGVIKKEDIRATKKDSVEIHKCYRPGDTILARVTIQQVILVPHRQGARDMYFGNRNQNSILKFILKVLLETKPSFKTTAEVLIPFGLTSQIKTNAFLLRISNILLDFGRAIKELQSYQLSTAENELGVVVAKSAAGETMIPISWVEMQCPKTYIKELRKVARVIPESYA